MRVFVMFVTALCLLFLLKLKWPYGRSVRKSGLLIIIIGAQCDSLPFFFFLTDVGAFQKCNLARIPSRVVMTRPGSMVTSLKQSLLRLDEFFRTNPHLFQMFNSSTYGGKDLLFEDSTVKLIDVKEKNTTQAWLGEKYFSELQSLSTCPDVLTAPRSLAVKLESIRTGHFLLIEFISLSFSLYSYRL